MGKREQRMFESITGTSVPRVTAFNAQATLCTVNKLTEDEVKDVTADDWCKGHIAEVLTKVC